jgi:hypothetical protein
MILQIITTFVAKIKFMNYILCNATEENLLKQEGSC